MPAVPGQELLPTVPARIRALPRDLSSISFSFLLDIRSDHAH